MASRWVGVSVMALMAAGAAVCIEGCGGKKPPPIVERPMVETSAQPRWLRGTITYEADLEGYGEALVQGYGLVVGLNGTGSSDTPIPIRAQIEREATRLLEQSQVTNATEFNVRDLLDSKDTAVVLVEASIPPGAPAGTRFDVNVGAIPTTSTTSLEGGRLWTTTLRMGYANPGGPETQLIGIAKGDVFINPFVLNRAGGESTGRSQRRVGRILGGGEVKKDMPLMLKLRTPNFSRARAILDAVNGRFPREPGQRYATAQSVSGRSEEQIVITVPPSWGDRTADFVETLVHTPIYQGDPERSANALVRHVKENPIDAPAVAWCWVALGTRCLPVIQELYTYGEVVPRMAALKAGAKLGDPLVIPHLAELAADPTLGLRLDLVELLGRMEPNPRISHVLRQLIDDEDLDVRVAAMEALLRQNDGMVQQIPVGRRAEFELFVVPSRAPMVYVTQQGAPRVIVFGADLQVKRPVLMTTWDDRLILDGTGPGEPLRLFYRDERTGKTRTMEPDGDLVSFIRLLGAESDVMGEEPGLGLAYSQAVSALFAMQESKAMEAPLVAEKDRYNARLLAAHRRLTPADRPETNLDPSGTVSTSPNLVPASQPSSSGENGAGSADR